jgi:hypothetical protein
MRASENVFEDLQRLPFRQEPNTIFHQKTCPDLFHLIAVLPTATHRETSTVAQPGETS